MKKTFVFTAAVAVIAFGAMAQDIAMGPGVMQLRVAGPNGVVMGPAVKGAPYSGEEVTQSDQVLGDGTHIHNQSSTKVYRDSEGRIRRETGSQITIFDPVSGVSYSLNSSTMTARKMTFSFVSAGSPAGTVMFRTKAPAEASPEVAARAEKMVSEAALKMAAESAADTAKAQLAKIVGEGEYTTTLSYSSTMARSSGKKEVLGTQVFEGVLSEGIRTTSTIEVGAVGNDRALNIVAERWYSPDLKTAMMTSHSDPRSGTETFRLTNVLRSEPSASLFQVPSEYKLVEPTAPMLAPAKAN